MTRMTQLREGTLAYATVAVTPDSVVLRTVRLGQLTIAPHAALPRGPCLVAAPAVWRHTALVGNLLGEF
jgi:hypothetical protein